MLSIEAMLQHVGIEVAPADVERSVELWQLLGFGIVEPPESLGEITWLERDGTQIHLMPTDSPTVPPRAHTAVVVADFEPTLAKLSESGFAVERRREHWGSPRAIAIAPGGHRIELMRSPPARGG